MYTPAPKVTIAGDDYTGATVGSISLSRGRDNVYAASRAGYGAIELINLGGFREPVVGDTASVEINDAAGQPTRVFTGFVSDWEARAVPRGDSNVLVVYRVQIVGLLARLNRRTVLAGGSPSELDGARVLAAIDAGLPIVWEEFSTLTAWDEVDPALTWDTVDPGYDPSLIDSGVYTVTALPAEDSGYNALQTAQEAAQSARGFVFETPEGFVAYADADRRPANAGAGFLDIPFGILETSGFVVGQNLADLTNRITVEFGADEAVTEEDTFSIGRFGLQAGRLSTILASQSDAEARAEDFLFSHSQPNRELNRISINLLTPMTDETLDGVISLRQNDAVRLVGAPASVLPDGFRGFVEGVSWRISQFDATVTLNVSNENLSFGSVLWGQVDATITWDDVDPALTWADARRVTT
jgi:hypothetical protein